MSLCLLLGHRDRMCFSGARTPGLSVPLSQKKQVLVKESGCLTVACSREFIYGEMEKMGPAKSYLVGP